MTARGFGKHIIRGRGERIGSKVMDLRSHGTGRRLIGVATSKSIVTSVVRAASVTGLLWAVVQFLDRFQLNPVPEGGTGVVLFGLAVSTVFLAVELALQLHRDPTRSSQRGAGRVPEEVLAETIVEYVRVLHRETPRRDGVILEFRNWTGKLLHRMGAARERTELGQIAIDSAIVLGDRRIQTSILIDELGWSMFKSGHTDPAIENLQEAIRMCDEDLTSGVRGSLIWHQKAKALRHLANIKGPHLQLPDARKLFEEPRELGRQMNVFYGRDNAAQLDSSEASAIADHLDKEVGPTGQIDPAGANRGLLDEALGLADAAEQSFQEMRESEKQRNTLRLKSRLLAHDSRKQRFRENQLRLERLDQEVSRSL